MTDTTRIYAAAIVSTSRKPPYTVMGSDPQSTGVHSPKELKELVERLEKLIGAEGVGVFTVTFVPGDFHEL